MSPRLLVALVFATLAIALAAIFSDLERSPRLSEAPASGRSAQAIVGRVVGVADGDTLTVLDATQTRHRIRLLGIDAPEKSQAGGTQAKRALSYLVFAQPVQIDWSKRDRYGRVLGIVRVAPPEAACRGQPACPATLDAGLEQILRGHAWWYRQFARDQPPRQRGDYERAQAMARKERRGLWRDADPQPPWEYRRQKKNH